MFEVLKCRVTCSLADWLVSSHFKVVWFEFVDMLVGLFLFEFNIFRVWLVGSFLFISSLVITYIVGVWMGGWLS